MKSMRAHIGGILGGVVFALLVGLVSGCGPPQPFEPGFYQVLKLRATPLSSSPKAVTVYRFTDQRSVDNPALIARYVSPGGISTSSATKPVAIGVTRAFVEGLEARGVSVVEMQTPFIPGEPRSATPVSITGTILDFESVVVGTGITSYDHAVSCRVLIQAYDNTTGRELWERTYLRNGDDVWFRGARFFAKALAEIIDEALNDADFVAILATEQSSVATPSTPDYVSYLKMIQEKVHSTWKYPAGVSGTQAVTLRFVLDIDGKLVSAEVVNSTDARLDTSAMEAINRASPFPPIPDNLKRLAGEPLVIKFTVSSKTHER